MEHASYVKTATIMANTRPRNAVLFSMKGTVYMGKDATSYIVNHKSLSKKRSGRPFISTIVNYYRSADHAADSSLGNS
jgi:hypothetical protein